VSRCILFSVSRRHLQCSKWLTACKMPEDDLTWNMLPKRSKRFPLRTESVSEGSSDLLLHPRAPFSCHRAHFCKPNQSCNGNKEKVKQSFKVLSSFQSEAKDILLPLYVYFFINHEYLNRIMDLLLASVVLQSIRAKKIKTSKVSESFAFLSSTTWFIYSTSWEIDLPRERKGNEISNTIGSRSLFIHDIKH
jgi:hypothetical protein